MSRTKASGGRHLVGVLVLRKRPDFPGDPERFLSPTAFPGCTSEGAGNGAPNSSQAPGWVGHPLWLQMALFLVDITVYVPVEFGEASGSKTSSQPNFKGTARRTGLGGAERGLVLGTPSPAHTHTHTLHRRAAQD